MDFLHFIMINQMKYLYNLKFSYFMIQSLHIYYFIPVNVFLFVSTSIYEIFSISIFLLEKLCLFVKSNDNKLFFFYALFLFEFSPFFRIDFVGYF